MINVTISDELIKKLISSESLIPKMVYCPHCGAKMDEQQNDIED